MSQPLPKRSEHQRLKLIDTLSLCTLPSAHQTERARRVRTLLKPRGKSVHQAKDIGMTCLRRAPRTTDPEGVAASCTQPMSIIGTVALGA